MEELLGTAGYFNVTKDEAKLLIHPHLGIDGYYLLRPTDDTRALCTICVSNRQKLMNYKLMQESQTRQYYIREQKFSSISELVRYYNRYPINPAHNTRLLYPVQAEQGDEYVALEPARDPPPINNPNPPVHNRRQPSLSQDQGPPALPDRPRPSSSSNYSNRSLPPVPTASSTADTRKRNSVQPKNNRTDSSSAEVVENLPGVHVDLQKHHVPIILDHFAGRDSSYLVRPSASSKGQFTISLVCESSILNFKINQDPSDGKYFVTPKKKFSTIKELLETHKTAPLKSKARSGAKIFLLHPITTPEVKAVLDMIKQKQLQQQQQQQSLPSQAIEQLPPPWKEYFDKNHQRPYFYNPQTKETVWERPSGGRKVSKASTMDQRSSPRHTPSHGMTNTLGVRHSVELQRSPRLNAHTEHRTSLPLPELPSKSPTPKRQGDTDRRLPQLPPKDITPTSSSDRVDQQYPLSQGGKSMPPLPPKDISTLPPLPEKVPSLPNKETPPPHSPNMPALPPKNPNDYNPSVNASLPPLPPKDPSSVTSNIPATNNPAISLPPLPPKVPSPTVKNFSDRPTEYEETVIIPSPRSQHSSVNAPLPPPIPLSDNEPPPTVSGLSVPPPAPPIPPQGIPGAPPPPPPISPALSSQRKFPSTNSSNSSESPSSSLTSNGNGGGGSGGRPFSANDLLQQKNRLKAKKEEDNEPKHRTGTFLENTLSSAIELRLVNIRNAMDSDEDTDVEEVDDDDDWD